MPWILRCPTCYEHIPDDELLKHKCIKPIFYNDEKEKPMTYSEFLKMKPYHGMPVTCTIDGKEITDAKLRIGDNGVWYICNNKVGGASTEKLLGYKYEWCIFSSREAVDISSYITNLKPMTNNTHPLADLKAGDYIYNGDQYRRVLSDVLHPELGELATVFVSANDHMGGERLKTSGCSRTLYELVEDGYKKLTATPRTIDDVLATLSDEDRKIVEEKIK